MTKLAQSTKSKKLTLTEHFFYFINISVISFLVSASKTRN